MSMSRTTLVENAGIEKPQLLARTGEEATPSSLRTAQKRPRSHIRPIPDKNPENSLVSDVPDDTPAADHECLDEEAPALPDSMPVVSAGSTAPANAPHRRSSRIKKEKVCQSYNDCRHIETYLFSEN